jgi:hypothetical protein
MKITPVNKLPYNGPKTHNGILRKIHKEAQEQGKDISFNYIGRTVYLFFGFNGFAYYLRRLETFSIGGFGRWVVTWHARRIKERTERRKRKLQFKKNNIQGYYNKVVKRFHATNEKRLAKGGGWEALTWRQFCKKYRYRQFINWGEIPKRHKHWTKGDLLTLRR